MGKSYRPTYYSLIYLSIKVNYLELLSYHNVATFGAVYCVVAEETAGRQIPMAFLEHIKDDFSKKYGAEEAPPNSLDKEYGYIKISPRHSLRVRFIFLLDMKN